MRSASPIDRPASPGLRRYVVGLCAAVCVSVVAALAPSAARACSCAGFSNDRQLERAYARADGAFTGRLVGVRPGPGRYARRYVYRVSTAYKGRGIADGRRVVVESASDGAACGLPRGGRERGLFVDRRGDGRLTGNLCAVVTPAQMQRAADRGASRAGVGVAGCGAG